MKLAEIPKFDDTFCWQGYGEIATFMYSFGGAKGAQGLERAIW